MNREERIGAGGSAEVFAWGEDAVLKLFRPEYAYAAPMEAERTRAVYAAGVASPAVLEEVEVDGRPGLVLTRVRGPSLLEKLASGEESPEAVGARLAELHAEVHSRTALDLPLLTDYVEGLPEGRRVCHGDFHPGNVLLGERPIPIDWVNAVAAHPAIDVARSCIAMRYQGLPDDADAFAAQRPVRSAITASYLARVRAIEATDEEVLRAGLGWCARALLPHEPENPERAELEAIAAGQGTGAIPV